MHDRPPIYGRGGDLRNPLNTHDDKPGIFSPFEILWIVAAGAISFCAFVSALAAIYGGLR